MSTVLGSLLAQLTNPLVRDLAWALASPNLLTNSPLAPDSSWYQNLLINYQPRLLALDKNPEILRLHCEPHQRLGLYFEALWHFYLLDHPRFQVLAHNWQQVVDGTTVGAFDFLVWDQHCQRIEHWELAVKFYLISQQDDAFNHAFGINPHDKLNRKHQHMLNSQLMLGQHSAVQPKLAQQGLTPQYKRLILKGRLYYPLQSQQCIDPESEYGLWGTTPPSSEFSAQHKLGWLTGGRASTRADRRQNFIDSKGNWYIQVEEDWLASTQNQVPIIKPRQNRHA